MGLPGFLTSKMFKIFLTDLFIIQLTLSAKAEELVRLQDADGFTDAGSSGRMIENIDRPGQESLLQSEAVTPLGVIYLVENKLAQIRHLQSDSAYLNNARRIIPKIPSVNLPVLSVNQGLRSQKRSALVEADILGLPDVSIDTRFFAHGKSISQMPAEPISTIKQSRHLISKEMVGVSKMNDVSKTNAEVTNKGLNFKSDRRDIDVDSSSVENFRKSGKSENSNQELNDRSLPKRTDSLKLDGIKKNQEKTFKTNNDQELNTKSNQEDVDSSKSNEFEINNPEKSEFSYGDDRRILEHNGENQYKNGLMRSTTYNEYNKQKSLNVNRIKYHTNNRVQTRFTNSRRPITEGQVGAQNGGETPNLQNPAGVQNTLDLFELTGRSGNERTSEPLERSGNLISIGNPLPAVGLLLGLQTGSKHSRHPAPTNQEGLQELIGQNLLGGVPSPVRSQSVLGSKSVNDELPDEPVVKQLDDNLLSIGNPLPPIGLALGLQTGSKHSQESTLFNDRIKTGASQEHESNNNLLSVQNPLSPVKLQLGAHIG